MRSRPRRQRLPNSGAAGSRLEYGSHSPRSGRRAEGARRKGDPLIAPSCGRCSASPQLAEQAAPILSGDASSKGRLPGVGIAILFGKIWVRGSTGSRRRPGSAPARRASRPREWSSAGGLCPGIHRQHMVEASADLGCQRLLADGLRSIEQQVVTIDDAGSVSLRNRRRPSAPAHLFPQARTPFAVLGTALSCWRRLADLPEVHALDMGKENGVGQTSSRFRSPGIGLVVFL